MFARNVHDSYTAKIGDTDADMMSPVTWRRNGRDLSWSNTRLVPLLNQAEAICDTIVSHDTNPPAHAKLFLLEKSRSFYLGPLSMNELDVVSGKRLSCFDGNHFSALTHVIDHLLLLRLSLDGMFEVIAFTKNPKTDIAYPQHRTAFFIYHATTDTVCGSDVYGTRITDCARSYPLPALLHDLREANLAGIARIMGDFFFTTINPSYAIPYQTLDTKNCNQQRARSLIDSNMRELIISVLQCHPEIVHPATITISLPTTPHSRARVHRQSLRTGGIPRMEVNGLVEFLVGVAIYDAPSSKEEIAGSRCPYAAIHASKYEPVTLTIETDGEPSYHDQIASRAAVISLWRKTLERDDSETMMLVAAHGPLPLNVKSALTEFLAE